MINIIIGIAITVLIELVAFFIYKISKKNKQVSLSEDELKTLVTESHEQGVLLASEADMIQNIFDFDEKDAKDIMTHRKEIVAIPSSMIFENVITFVNENQYSRYPIFDGDLDNIIGILHLRDVLKYMEQKKDISVEVGTLTDILMPVDYVPETNGINTLFTRMQSKKNHMIIVVDEYGQTSGLLSMEDILEEIVGNIFDEYDEEEDHIKRIRENIYQMEGCTPLEDVEKQLQVSFEDCEYETLNGLLIDCYGSVPKDHETFSVSTHGFDFRVLDVKSRVVGHVLVKPHSSLERH